MDAIRKQATKLREQVSKQQQQLLQEMNGATGVAMDNSFLQSLFNGLVKEGEILGSVRAGVHWTPAVFASAQKESVDSRIVFVPKHILASNFMALRRRSACQSWPYPPKRATRRLCILKPFINHN